MAIDDLRNWLKEVDKMGEIERFDGADWNLEVGCIVELYREKTPPVLLFDNIKGYPKGYRVVCSVLETPTRMSLTLNLPPCHSISQLLEIMPGKISEWTAKSKEFPPEVVDTGPILENVHSGDEVDLFEFPVPKWHEIDGGRYIGTGHAVITQDPDTGEVNLGTYRVVAHDKKTTGIFMDTGRHAGLHIQKYHERGQAAPVAMSVGHHPLVLGIACQPVVVPEYNFMGAIRGEPIKVIKEEVTGLPIPADSEIVLAGWCPPGKTKTEGCFGEWTGYASGQRLAPVIEVERIYHRNEPILVGAPPGRSPYDTVRWSALFRSSLLYNEFIATGVSDVKGIWVNEAGGSCTIVIVSIKQRYAGHAKRAALIASQSQATSYANKYVIVVDEDIDPTNINEVLWAMAQRSDPEKDIDIIRRTRGAELDPMIRKPTKAFFNSKAIIDACKPYEWMDEFPPEVKASPELVARVKQKWDKLTKL